MALLARDLSRAFAQNAKDLARTLEDAARTARTVVKGSATAIEASLPVLGYAQGMHRQPGVRKGEQSGSVTWSSGDGPTLEVKYRGDIEFTDDDRDVRRIAPGGWLTIRARERSGPDRALEFRAMADGAIERRFRVNGVERPFDPEGRAWAATALPRVIRQTGMGAARRVARIMRSSGPTGVLAEVSLIEGSFAKRIYLAELLKVDGLEPRAVQQALSQAGREIDSDFELASLLIGAERLVTRGEARKAYLGAARTIESDFEMRRVFASAIRNGQLSAAAVSEMLDAGAAIDSDFEAASLLVQVAKARMLDPAAGPAFFRVLATVDSAFEKNRVLTAVVKEAAITPDLLTAVLDAASGLNSDFEAASCLLLVAKEHGAEGVLRAPFFKALGRIGSPFERGRVLQTLARRGDLSNETVLAVIGAARAMSGEFEKAQVLMTIARAHTLDRTARDAYIDASAGLGEFEQGRVLSALAGRP
jgi:hypothetical protein